MPDEGKIIKPDRPMINEIDLEEEVVGTVIESLTPSMRSLPGGEEKQAKENPRYCKFLQNKGMNALAQVSNKSFTVDPITGVATAEQGGVCIMAEDLNTLNLSPQTLKLLDYLIARLTQNFPHGVDIPANQIDARRMLTVSVREFMEICGLSDYTNAKKQFIDSIESLSQLKLRWLEGFTYTPEGKRKPVREVIPWNTSVFDSSQDAAATLKRGRAYLKLSYDLAKYYTQSQVIPHALEAYKIDNREDPHAYRLYRKMENHHAQNILKPNANRISVKVLLEAAPDIPTYEEVRAGTNQVKRLIIDRFEDSLNSLKRESGLIKDWWYCNAKGEPLTDAQVDNYSYSEWITWLVEFRMPDDYPEDEQRERKEKGRAIRTEKKEAAKKRAAKPKNKSKSEKSGS